MQEFESISASSYDPSALATKLTAKAAEGWSVVAIVPTGGDVTAFVTRDKGGADADSKPSTDAAETKAEAVVTADDNADDVPAPALPAKAEPVIEPKPEPASEPSGWAIAPEPASPPVEPTGVQPAVTIAPAAVSTPATPAAIPSYEPVAAATPAAATPAAATPAAESAAAPTVPAGWYADPAGRFELRYWDGSTWTEHVSRAGQQFTDPPVA